MLLSGKEFHIKKVALTVTLIATLLASTGCTQQTVSRPPALPIASAQILESLDKQASDNERSLLEQTSPGVTVPTVARVRYVRPLEWAATAAKCIGQSGFSTSVGQDGGIESGTIPHGQSGAYALAAYTCKVQYPIDPKYSVPYSTQELDYLYHYFTKTLTPCLTKHKQNVLSTPSRQRFGDTYGKDESWDPYTNVSGISEKEFGQLKAKCPELPSGFRGN